MKHQKPAGAARRIADTEIRVHSRVGLDTANDRLDQHPRREVLPGAFLPFARRFLQQPLKCCCLDVDIERCPFGFIDHPDELLQIHGIVEAGYRFGEDLSEQVPLATQRTKNGHVVVGQGQAGLVTRLGQEQSIFSSFPLSPR